MPRHVAKELIAYVKSIKVRANYEDPLAKSAFEFGRQMASPKLVKVNPTFTCTLDMIKTAEPPVVVVEYLDGGKLSLATAQKTCADVRSEVYERASEAEEQMEAKGAGGAGDKGGAGAKGGGGGGGGGAGGAKGAAAPPKKK